MSRMYVSKKRHSLLAGVQISTNTMESNLTRWPSAMTILSQLGIRGTVIDLSAMQRQNGAEKNLCFRHQSSHRTDNTDGRQ